MRKTAHGARIQLERRHLFRAISVPSSLDCGASPPCFYHIQGSPVSPRLCNSASTMTSQLIDTVVVVLITYFYAKALLIKEGEPL